MNEELRDKIKDVDDKSPADDCVDESDICVAIVNTNTVSSAPKIVIDSNDNETLNQNVVRNIGNFVC